MRRLVVVMHLSMLNPERGARAYHGDLIVKSVPRVAIFNIRYVPRIGILIVRDQVWKNIRPPSLGGNFA